MDNGYTYTVWNTDETSEDEMNACGYPVGNTSTDGNLIVVDKKDNEEPTQTTTPTKPTYVVESMPNWPYLSHTEAKQLVTYYATTNGGSDGWNFNFKVL